MTRTDSILLIDDDPQHARALENALRESGADAPRLEWVRSLSCGLDRVRRTDVAAVFLSLVLPDGGGVAAIESVLSSAPVVPLVLVGGVHDEDVCRMGMSRGAQDYLLEGHLDAYAFTRALRNIAERETARREALEQQHAQVTLDSIGDAVLSVDTMGAITYLNPIAEHMTGWSRRDAVGRPLAEVFRIIDSVTRTPPTDPLALAIQLNRPVALSAHCVLVRRDGCETAIEDSAAPVRDKFGRITGAVIVFHDVGVARAMALEMSRLAQHDALTELPNRTLLKERLEQALRLAQRNRDRLAVIYVDVDGFKKVNDSLGHAIGDRLLKAIAVRLVECVRRSDTVSRHGGDEFVVLLSGISHRTDATVTADKILAEIKKAYAIDDHVVSVSASLGVSTYPEHGDDADTLLENADVAMYYAKAQGRDGYRAFDRTMSLEAVERQSIESQLRHAIEDRGLVLHYQPKVNLRTGAVTSVEALVRWQHPERGLLLPAHFLSIAEDNGSIVPMGRWVLREVCRQIREWLDAGRQAVPVAVNVSAPEFRAEGFLEGVRGALHDSRLDSGYLEIELTESVLMGHAESSAAALTALRSMGVGLAVDDFGTGYSSLSYLTRFSIDALKLDQSLVRNVCARSDDAVVASAVIGMARNLKHRVIAEGVETAEQVAFLLSHDCDEAQGFFFGRPVPAVQLGMLLEPVSSTLGAMQQGARQVTCSRHVAGATFP